MPNKEFQELKRQWSCLKKDEADIIGKMRENLLRRNNMQEEYALKYTEQGVTYNINSASVEELFSIDGDMCPQGK